MEETLDLNSRGEVLPIHLVEVEEKLDLDNRAGEVLSVLSAELEQPLDSLFLTEEFLFVKEVEEVFLCAHRIGHK